MENNTQNINTNNKQINFDELILSEKIDFIKKYIHETYQYLGQVEVKGHQNSKIMTTVFDALFKSTTMLDSTLEEAMNFETSKQDVEKPKDDNNKKEEDKQ